MCNMTFTSPRATLEELLEFANRVREAGGGNPLSALMPAVPNDTKQCLIAKNLNFNCAVDGLDYIMRDGNPWAMHLDSEELACKIGAVLDLEVEWDGDSEEGRWAVILPHEIGQVASDFDSWASALRHTRGATGAYVYEVDSYADDEEKERLTTFIPLIEEAIKEAYNIATLVNEKGEIVL